MSLTQFLVMAVVALLVTVPVVLLIPRARTSPAFDRLLWAATFVVGFLAAWVAVAMAKDAGTLNAVAVGDTAILPVIIGALGSALVLNLPLWLADSFGGSGGQEIEESDLETRLAIDDHGPQGRNRNE